jgi:putative restriction endonuclease
VLEAAHIRPYKQGGQHAVTNGVLLRSDFHTLFDAGYMTITPQGNLEVSRRIREEFDNGKNYYQWHGGLLRRPAKDGFSPDRAALEWHNQNVFRG